MLVPFRARHMVCSEVILQVADLGKVIGDLRDAPEGDVLNRTLLAGPTTCCDKWYAPLDCMPTFRGAERAKPGHFLTS